MRLGLPGGVGCVAAQGAPSHALGRSEIHQTALCCIAAAAGQRYAATRGRLGAPASHIGRTTCNQALTARDNDLASILTRRPSTRQHGSATAGATTASDPESHRTCAAAGCFARLKPYAAALRTGGATSVRGNGAAGGHTGAHPGGSRLKVATCVCFAQAGLKHHIAAFGASATNQLHVAPTG